MSADRVPPPRPVGQVIGAGALTGLIAGFAVGVVDAIASWRSAAQFVPHVASRLRFVLFTGTSYAAAGWVLGLVLAIVLVTLSRGTRLGDLVRFAWRDHATRRAREPRQAVAGLALAIAFLPCLCTALFVGYRATVPFVANRHVITLEVLVAMAATVGALAAAVPLTFVVGKLLELALQKLARPAPWLASPWAPFVAVGAIVVAALVVWAKLSWETVKILPLRGPFVLVLGLGFALPAARPARAAVAFIAPWFVWFRRALWVVQPPVLLVLVLVFGGSASVIKAVTAYTGLGGPIAHQLRRAFDWDHDGYARYLGGGDCDDSDPTVHPGAPEIPDDGIDQNCVGGDASAKPVPQEPFAPVPSTVPPDFNILLVTIDTTRADHLGIYDYPRNTSPNLDKLAKEGVWFRNGWAHAPSTRYSMPAILTGRLPLDVYYDTSVDGWPGISLKATTLAESLAARGFYTGAITNYEYFDKRRHMDQGFAEYDNENARLHTMVGSDGPARTRGSSSKQQSDKAIGFVDRHAAQRWFLWVHYYDPHADYEPHPEVKSFGSEPIDLYDGEILFTDLHIGRLIDELRAKGLYDKTVIVVTGDHGEGFGEHGVPHHGYHLYAAQTKVPLIIRVPGLPARESTTPAGHTDILPTLVNLAGGTQTTEMMGRSLVDILAGGAMADRDRTIFQQLSYEGNHEMRAGVSRDCHVIYNVSPDTSWEVYRVDRDPMEAEDLANDDDECADTRRDVEKWYDRSTIPPGAGEALIGDPKIATPIADLGDAVRLLAVDVPAHAHPGDSVDVTWTFQALGKVPAGWKLFVHVERPDKTFINADHDPARPLEWWQAGQFIRYTRELALPKGTIGRYTLRVGLYKGAAQMPITNAHAPVENGGVAAATIEVGP